ncbi:hypothetical protein BU26DRAFT_65795 [Trematosphaeria pertusa]|uniref:Heterokaryon incompatibility domain-containing protein n=1 Tax=Trematosphaeria pertusa TaxID=390896 RepID=A0A6A6I8N6_9PLEO|nr:uncharacterized protein BU26DRAFT_65795 [Trematosphaeria pertusa]KAF2246312.1 hypothetical protein BU26DRAFT_65795 [Trematosphaeria pertusa]
MEVLGSTSRILHIRPNLHHALKHLRQTDTARTLWIDALCINQEDIEERNVQVKRMASIYKLAYRVVVWLGPTSPDQSNEWALGILQKLGEQTEYTRDYYIMASPTAKGASWDREVPISLSEQDLTAIRHILERPWWDRLWIWQEIHLGSPRSVAQCGSSSISWYSLRRALQNLHLRGEAEFGQFLPESLRSSRAFFSRNQLHDLETLLERTKLAKFSVGHDRIFALFGFLDPAFVARINADYALPVEHLFKDVCRAWNAHNGEIYFLDFCEPPEEACDSTEMDLPSWVPNWLRCSDLEGFKPGFASGTAGSGSVTFTDRELLVYGVKCATVEEVGAPAPLQGSIKPVLRMWKQLVRHCTTDCTRSDYSEDFIATLQCGETKVMFPDIAAFPSIHDCLESFYLEESEPLTSDCIRGRSFFRSSVDHYGICPPGTKAGDVVCVLLGLDYPIMLRPSTESVGGYRVLGLAYVHGLMNAEALLGPLPIAWRGHYDDDWEGVPLQAFTDPQIGKVVYDDPRLGALPEDWEFKAAYEPEAPAIRWFKNRKTGRITRRDPRLLPDALRSCGTPIQELRLV